MFFSSGRKLYHSPFPQVDTIGEKWFTDKGSKARKRVKKCDKGAIFFKILLQLVLIYYY